MAITVETRRPRIHLCERERSETEWGSGYAYSIWNSSRNHSRSDRNIRSADAECSAFIGLASDAFRTFAQLCAIQSTSSLRLPLGEPRDRAATVEPPAFRASRLSPFSSAVPSSCILACLPTALALPHFVGRAGAFPGRERSQDRIHFSDELASRTCASTCEVPDVYGHLFILTQVNRVADPSEGARRQLLLPEREFFCAVCTAIVKFATDMLDRGRCSRDRRYHTIDA